MMPAQRPRPPFSKLLLKILRWLPVRLSLVIVFSLLVAGGLTAQTAPPPVAGESAKLGSARDDGNWVHDALHKHTIQLGLLAGAGTGLGHSGGTQFGYAGGRGGIVLSNDFLPGLLRGNFEWAADVLPMYVVFPPQSAVWGGSIRPAIWQWNFTSFRTVAPYVAAVGGVVFTRQNVPPGDTSQINFTPGIAFGSNIFIKQRRAFFFEGSIAHLSSASLGNRNPGYNVNFLFTAGFSWFKGGH
ncbi:MAG TPA: acyloxyacyl hydrolase [Candidatus Acidoferrales bacterium]